MPRLLGIAFPFKKGPMSVPAGVSDDELLKESIIQIVMVNIGERIMRPDFGCSSYNFVFDNNDELLEITVQRVIREALTRYEPRVIVTDVQVSGGDEDLIVTIGYVVVATRQTQQVSVTMGVQ